MRGLRSVFVAVVVAGVALVAAPAAAQQHEVEARAAFTAGKAAYEAKRYDEALEAFQRCYTLSGEPALLYNISSALQSMNRPGEAADALADYLKARPGDPNRAEIEGRVASLRKAQELVDREKARKAAAEAQAARERDARRAGDSWLSVAEADRRVELERIHERAHRRRVLGLALGLTLGPIVLGGIIVGVVCGLGKCTSSPAKDFDYGRTLVTP